MWRVVDARGVTTTITAECVIPGGDHTSARWRFTYDEGKASADVDADDDTNPREALCVWAGYQVTEIRGPGEATTAEQLADMAAKLDAARAEAADRVLRAVVDVAEEREPEKPLPTHAAVEAVQRLRAELERVRWSEKEQRVRADRAEKERDAALAAVDAVRADYAPRQEPPTAEEVRALARLWPHHDGAAVVLLRVLSRTGDRVAPHAVSVIVENDGTVEGFAANDMDKLHRADGWRAECPDGPVAWSHLAAMVARGGDRG